MKYSELIMPVLVTGTLILGAVMVVMRMTSSDDVAATAAIEPPELSSLALEGKAAFDSDCAACHGANATGTTKGPPFVHDIYNPGHHSDKAFFLATRQGVRQHHWPFGDMPPQPKVTEKELAAIVRYLRELQEANGIFYRPHTM